MPALVLLYMLLLKLAPTKLFLDTDAGLILENYGTLFVLVLTCGALPMLFALMFVFVFVFILVFALGVVL